MTAYMAWLTHQNNPATTATISATSSASGYGIANVKTLPIVTAWRSTSLATQDIEVDFGIAQTVDLLALINHNLSSTAVITIAAGTTNSYLNYSSSMLWRDFTAFKWLSSVQSYRYWRIRISDPDNDFAYIKVGYLVIGQATLPIFNFRTKWATAIDYYNIEQGSNFGVLRAGEIFSGVSLKLEFGPLSATNMATLAALYADLEKNIYPMLFLPERDGVEAYFLRFDTDFSQKYQSSYLYTTLEFVEDSYGKRF